MMATYFPIYRFNGSVMDYVVFVGIGMLIYVALTAYECLKERKEAHQ